MSLISQLREIKRDHTIDYPDDGYSYSGDAIKRDDGSFVPHGSGTMTRGSHEQPVSTYEGQFSWGQPHGYGKSVSSKGETYEGWWAYGLKHGKGTTVHEEGETYVGDYFKGKRHGKGRCSRGDADEGMWYEGQWHFGLMNGLGEKECWSSTSRWLYEGWFVDGRMEGTGEIVWNGASDAGIMYEGDFLENTPHGTGKLSELAVKDGRNETPTRVLSENVGFFRKGKMCINMKKMVLRFDRSFEGYDLCDDVAFETENVKNGLDELARQYAWNVESEHAMRVCTVHLEHFGKWCAQLIQMDASFKDELFDTFVPRHFASYRVGHVLLFLRALWRTLTSASSADDGTQTVTANQIFCHVMHSVMQSESGRVRNFWRSVATGLLDPCHHDRHGSTSLPEWVIEWNVVYEVVASSEYGSADFMDLAAQLLEDRDKDDELRDAVLREWGGDGFSADGFSADDFSADKLRVCKVHLVARKAAARLRFDEAIRKVVLCRRIVHSWMEKAATTTYAPGSALQRLARAVAIGDALQVQDRRREYRSEVFERNVRRKMTSSELVQMEARVDAEVDAHVRDV